MKYRHLKGSPYEGNEYEEEDPYIDRLRAEAIEAFRFPTPRQSDRYTRDGRSFDAQGRLIASGGWPVEEIPE